MGLAASGAKPAIGELELLVPPPELEELEPDSSPVANDVINLPMS